MCLNSSHEGAESGLNSIEAQTATRKGPTSLLIYKWRYPEELFQQRVSPGLIIICLVVVGEQQQAEQATAVIIVSWLRLARPLHSAEER